MKRSEGWLKIVPESLVCVISYHDAIESDIWQFSQYIMVYDKFMWVDGMR